MDIVTHAGIGLIAALPVLPSQPALALGIIAGSVLPDLDALSRVLGKRMFLRAHQTWTHSLPVQLVASILVGIAAQALSLDGVQLGIGLFCGLVIHSLLDLSNTLGVTLFAPFSKKRICLEWVFFIDAVVLTATVLATTIMLWKFFRTGEAPRLVAEIFFGVMILYFGMKALLRQRAASFAPESVSLIPSALWPWRFLGAVERDNEVHSCQVNGITGRKEPVACHSILDAPYLKLLSEIPEFNLMRELSPLYHVVSVQGGETGDRLFCRDLRTRNFKTTFGDLELQLDRDQRVTSIQFHV